jgi:transposase
MRQIREVLRLHHEAHLGERQIAAICLMGKGTVQRFLRRAAAAGLAWPLPEDLDDTQLERLLFPPAPSPAGTRPQPDFTKVHQELKSNRSVTLQLLWEEYKESQPDGINYSCYVATIFMLRNHLRAMTDASAGNILATYFSS